MLARDVKPLQLFRPRGGNRIYFRDFPSRLDDSGSIYVKHLATVQALDVVVQTHLIVEVMDGELEVELLQLPHVTSSGCRS